MSNFELKTPPGTSPTGSDSLPKPNAEMRAKIWLTLTMWGSIFAVFSLLSLIEPRHEFGPDAGMRAAVCLLGTGFCYALHRLLSSMAERPFKVRAATLIVAAPIAAEIFAWFNYFGFAWLHGGPMAFIVDDWNLAIRQLLLYTWFFIAWAGLYLAIEYSFLARDEAERAAELQIHAQSAKLQALSNQLNPHFLFNSLNSVSALVLEGERQDADRALGLLSSYLRRTLALDPMSDVPLAKELALHSDYLAVEKLRYPDMEVAIRVPPRLQQAMVPALILQPFIDNAIKHGIARATPPTYLRLDAEDRAGRLEIRICNGGKAAQAASDVGGHGIGLTYVRNRLELRFGDDQEITTRDTPHGFEARLSLPLIFK